MEHYTLEIKPHSPIPEHLIKEVQSKFAYVDEAIARAEIASTGDAITLYLYDQIGEQEKANLEEKTQRVVSSMILGAIGSKIEILEDHLDRPTPYQEDPNLELIERGELYQETAGVFTLGPLLTRLIDYFERRFMELADSFHARPYRFPALIPASFLARVNYFRAFPHSLTFVTHLREDLDVIDQFSQHASCGDNGALEMGSEPYADIKTLLSPAVCYHLYLSLADRPLPGGKLIATAVGDCFRYEAINLSSLERLWNFTMREVIFVGAKDYVLENREIARQRMNQVFKEIGLAYRVESANDPFFVGEFRKQVAFQTAFQLKFEIRASLPFKASTLAVGSYNYHQDFFGRHLNITLPDGSPAHTGCVAFGLERIAYAYLAQYGFDSKRWPSPVREAVQ